MKQCKNCKTEKSTNEYYSGSSTCKECTKVRVKQRADRLKNDPEWVEKERIRGREKYYRLNYRETSQPSPDKKREIIARYKERYPEKVKAISFSQHLKPTTEGNHLHHWSYNDKHHKSVIELPLKDHSKIHRFMVYDPERLMYRRCTDNVLLDTKEEHLNWIDYVLKNH